jgi:hypothetical protein
VSELLNLRVIAEPPAAARAADHLAELLDLDRPVRGPYPSRKSPGLDRFYLAGRLHPAESPALAGQVDRLEREVARLRAALELLTACQHGQGLDCPACEPVPDLVRQALQGEAVRPA